MIFVNIIVISMFVALGIAFANGKGLDLVAGYNTLSEKEKDKVNKKELSKYMTLLMFLLAFCWCILSVGLLLEYMWLFWGGFGLFICVTIFFVIYMNTGSRLNK